MGIDSWCAQSGITVSVWVHLELWSHCNCSDKAAEHLSTTLSSLITLAEGLPASRLLLSLPSLLWIMDSIPLAARILGVVNTKKRVIVDINKSRNWQLCTWTSQAKYNGLHSRSESVRNYWLEVASLYLIFSFRDGAITVIFWRVVNLQCQVPFFLIQKEAHSELTCVSLTLVWKHWL